MKVEITTEMLENIEFVLGYYGGTSKRAEELDVWLNEVLYKFNREELEEVIKRVDKYCLTNIKEKERVRGEIDRCRSAYEQDDYHDELTDLEHDSDDLDEVWVFLEKCSRQSLILDWPKYNGIKSLYV